MAKTYDSLGNIAGIEIPTYNVITEDDDGIVKAAKQEAQEKQYASTMPTSDIISYIFDSASFDTTLGSHVSVLNTDVSTVNSLGLSTDVANQVSLGTQAVVSNTNAANASDTANALTTTVANPTGVGSSTNSSVLGAGTASTSSFSINSQYQSGNYRLVDFNYNSGGDDNSKRSYMKICGQTALLKASLQSNSVNYTQLQSLYSALTSKYTAFILLNIQENLQERQSLMPTVGDSFAATFSGADPQILTVNGLLPFDNQADKSWFIYFMNAYVNFLRASKLAKYKCYLKLVLPDYQTYNCYPVSITCGLQSDSDTLVNFGMSSIVMNDWSNKAYGYAASTAAASSDSTSSSTATTATANTGSSDTSIVGEVLASGSSGLGKIAQIQAGTNSTAADIGTATKKSNWWEKTVEATNNLLSGSGVSTAIKAYSTVTQLKGRGFGSL